MRKAWLEGAQWCYIPQRKAGVCLILVDPFFGTDLTLGKEGVRKERWVLTTEPQWGRLQALGPRAKQHLTVGKAREMWDSTLFSTQPAFNSFLKHRLLGTSSLSNSILSLVLPHVLHFLMPTDHYCFRSNPCFSVITLQLWTCTYSLFTEYAYVSQTYIDISQFIF